MQISEKALKGQKPVIMIVDDVMKNLQVVGTTLIDEGYEITMANHGNKALGLLEKVTPDLILLDIMMPEINGYEVCRRIKEMERLKNVPVIFLTAKTELDDLVKGFEIGAVDYITKPFKQEELLLRVKTHLDLKFSKELIEKHAEEIEEYNSKLEKSNNEKEELLNLLNSELKVAADYVYSLLPPKMDGEEILADWKFIPSAELSGDSFGYHWIDEEHFAIYMLDVCGHGIGSALLSVSALNALKFQSLPNADFRKPEEVLRSLNKSFQMIDHNDKYFTIWYGVYNVKTKEIRHATAGHHEAILIDENKNKTELFKNNPLIGLEMDTDYFSETSVIKPPQKFYLFSDGAFEVSIGENLMWEKEDMISLLTKKEFKDKDEIETVLNHLEKINIKENLEDDFSFIKIVFKS